MNVTDKIPVRIANTLLNALKGGVVLRTGLGYIMVGADRTGRSGGTSNLKINK